MMDEKILAPVVGVIVTTFAGIILKDSYGAIKEVVKKKIFGEKPVILIPPPPRYDLVGRKNLLQDLKQQLFAGSCLALCGMPGVGKTALALQLVHDREVQKHFKDGILWAGLGQDADVFSHLGYWAAALGVPWGEIANLSGVDIRRMVIHKEISKRRMLLVVDDVWSNNEAKAFRLGDPNCAHLITTRLQGIATNFADGEITQVEDLSERNGLDLLGQFIPEVVKSSPDRARELLVFSGGLPLALIIIGRYLRKLIHSKQLNGLDNVIQQLQDTRNLTGLLKSIEISGQALDWSSRSTLRALSVFPPKPNNFSEEAALAVSDGSVEALSTLIDGGLVEVDGQSCYTVQGVLENSGQNCYALHQVVSKYATSNCVSKEPYRRMVEYYSHYVTTHRRDYRALDQERENILAALQAAHDLDMKKELISGTNAVFYFLKSRGLYKTAETHLNHARAAAKSLDDTWGLISTLFNLGQTADAFENVKQAEKYYQKGLLLAEKINDTRRIIDFLRNLGIVTSKQGDYSGAEKYYQKGLLLAEKINDTRRICGLLQSLGILESQRGNYPQAEKYLQEGLVKVQTIDDPGRTSSFNVSLGILENQCGDFGKAREYLQEAYELACRTKDPMRISSPLVSLAILANQCGDFKQAEEYFREGLKLARITGNRGRISGFLVGWGFLEVIRGNYAQAEEYLQEGLNLVEPMGYKERASVLLAYLGALETKRGNFEKAEENLKKGLNMALEIDNPEKISILQENWGILKYERNEYEKAEEYLKEGLENARKIKNPERISSLYKNLGALKIRCKKFKEAEKYLLKGLVTACKIQHQWRISEIYNEWGEYYLAQQELDSAHEAFDTSFTLTHEMGAQEFAAIALYGLARTAANQKNMRKARHRGQKSLKIFKKIGHRKASDVEQWLKMLH